VSAHRTSAQGFCPAAAPPPSNDRQQRDKGSSHQPALRALAFKWLRILYRCWQTRTPYDESVYLNALKKRGSPLLGQFAQKT
jgi:hypothetical protein